MPWLLWGDVQYTQNGTVTNPCGNGLLGSGSLAHYLKKNILKQDGEDLLFKATAYVKANSRLANTVVIPAENSVSAPLKKKRGHC